MQHMLVGFVKNKKKKEIKRCLKAIVSKKEQFRNANKSRSSANNSQCLKFISHCILSYLIFFEVDYGVYCEINANLRRWKDNSERYLEMKGNFRKYFCIEYYIFWLSFWNHKYWLSTSIQCLDTINLN